MLDTCIVPPPSIGDKPDRLFATETSNDTNLSIYSPICIKDHQEVSFTSKTKEYKNQRLQHPPHISKKQKELNQSAVFESPLWRAYCNSLNTEAFRRRVAGIKIYAKRNAQALFLNACALMGEHPQNCVLMTVTLPDPLLYYSKDDQNEAQSRIHSWHSNKSGFSYVFGGKRKYCKVMGPQENGTIHWHYIVALDEDVGTGVDHIAVKKRDYTTIGESLRSIWKRMRISGKKYKLGRVEIMPVRAKEAVARYLAGHVTREIRNRPITEKGKRAAKKVSYSKGWTKIDPKNVYREGVGPWRLGVIEFMKVSRVERYEDLKKVVGRYWAYLNKSFIIYLGLQKTA